MDTTTEMPVVDGQIHTAISLTSFHEAQVVARTWSEFEPRWQGERPEGFVAYAGDTPIAAGYIGQPRVDRIVVRGIIVDPTYSKPERCRMSSVLATKAGLLRAEETPDLTHLAWFLSGGPADEDGHCAEQPSELGSALRQAGWVRSHRNFGSIEHPVEMWAHRISVTAPIAALPLPVPSVPPPPHLQAVGAHSL